MMSAMHVMADHQKKFLENVEVGLVICFSNLARAMKPKRAVRRI